MPPSISVLDEQIPLNPPPRATKRNRSPSVSSETSQAPGGWPEHDHVDSKRGTASGAQHNTSTAGPRKAARAAQEDATPRAASNRATEPHAQDLPKTQGTRASLRKMLWGWARVPVDAAARALGHAKTTARNAYTGSQAWLAQHFAPAALGRVTQLNAQLHERVGTHIDSIALKARQGVQELSASAARLASAGLAFVLNIVEKAFSWLGALADSIAASFSAGFEAGTRNTRAFLDGLRERLSSPRR